MPMSRTTIIREPYPISISTVQPYSIRGRPASDVTRYRSFLSDDLLLIIPPIVTLCLRIGQLLYASVLFNICREHISVLFGSHV